MATKTVAKLAPITAAAGGVDNYTSINSDTKESRLAFFAAIQNAEGMQNFINVPLPVVDIVVRKAEGIIVDDKSGETRDGHITTLVLADGKAIGTNSASVKNAIDVVFATIGQPHVDWSVLTVVPTSNSSKNGNYTSLRVVDFEAPNA